MYLFQPYYLVVVWIGYVNYGSRGKLSTYCPATFGTKRFILKEPKKGRERKRILVAVDFGGVILYNSER